MVERMINGQFVDYNRVCSTSDILIDTDAAIGANPGNPWTKRCGEVDTAQGLGRNPPSFGWRQECWGRAEAWRLHPGKFFFFLIFFVPVTTTYGCDRKCIDGEDGEDAPSPCIVFKT